MLGNLHSFQGLLGHECLFSWGGGAIIQFTIHTFFLLTMNIYAAYITFALHISLGKLQIKGKMTPRPPCFPLIINIQR